MLPSTWPVLPTFSVLPCQGGRPSPDSHQLQGASKASTRRSRNHFQAARLPLASLLVRFTWHRFFGRRGPGACVVKATKGPLKVSGYAVRPVVATVPDIGQVVAYVVDEEADRVEDEEIPEWVPAEWLSPVMGDSDVSDVYGAIGVWPAAFVAAEAVMRYAPKVTASWACLELGCGAGFPSLVAARLDATVYALDTEQLTLDLLQTAFDEQGQGRLIPLLGDAEDLPEEPMSSVSLIVVSDLLYSVELGSSLGTSLAKWLHEKEGRELILTDGGRSGRQAFLQAFKDAYGSPAFFEDVPVPSWAPQKGDFFDGSATTTVGLLRY